jgi:hypothetical protein
MAPKPPISAPPWAVLGYRADGRPIRPIAGGSEPAPEPAATGPEPDDEQEPGTEPDDWTPPTREEWEAQQASLKRASAEAANRRKWLKAHGIDPKTGEKLDPDPDPVPDPAAPKPQDPAGAPQGLSEAEVKRLMDRAVAETQLKGVRQMRAFAVGFNEELAKAGWNGTRLGHLMKLLDLDGIDIDDDGEITGLAEQIEELKAEWPEFFKRNRSTVAKPGGVSGQNGTPAGNVDTADKKPPAPQPKSWAEQVAEKLMRG